jgi:hypothetical protein
VNEKASKASEQDVGENIITSLIKPVKEFEMFPRVML